jgi:hypothetical protein
MFPAMMFTYILDTQSSQPKSPTKALNIAAAKTANPKKPTMTSAGYPSCFSFWVTLT